MYIIIMIVKLLSSFYLPILFMFLVSVYTVLIVMIVSNLFIKHVGTILAVQ